MACPQPAPLSTVVSNQHLAPLLLLLGAVGTLDQQDVKTGCALGNGLHHIIQQRDEGYEAQTEIWHPTVWTLSWSFFL